MINCVTTKINTNCTFKQPFYTQKRLSPTLCHPTWSRPNTQAELFLRRNSRSIPTDRQKSVRYSQNSEKLLFYNPPPKKKAKVLRLTEELRLTLDGLDNAEEVRNQVPESTLSRVSRWMNGNNNHPNSDELGSASNLASVSTKGRSSATGNLIRKLENDKESLSLQVGPAYTSQ